MEETFLEIKIWTETLFVVLKCPLKLKKKKNNKRDKTTNETKQQTNKKQKEKNTLIPCLNLKIKFLSCVLINVFLCVFFWVLFFVCCCFVSFLFSFFFSIHINKKKKSQRIQQGLKLSFNI